MTGGIGDRMQSAATTAPVFPRIHAFATLFAAWHRIEHNDGGAGVDGVTLEDFELTLDERLHELERDLRDGMYQPQPLLAVSVPKPAGGERRLAIPSVRDRVAQCAAALVVTPILDAEFEAASFGFRHDRGVPHAVAEVRRYHEQGYRWVVDADIDNFFDEVDHARLLTRLEKSIPEPALIRLVRLWITTPIQREDGLIERTRGIPQGGPISPVLANLYLDEFDEALERRGLKLVRFADDFVILCKHQPAAEAALEISEELLHEMSLALDPEKTQVTSFDRGFRYLGHLFVGGVVLPSPNRLHRKDPDDDPESVRPAASPAEAAPAQHELTPPVPTALAPREPTAPTPTPERHVEVVTPHAGDTALSRALAEALEAAGRHSLLLAEPLAREATAVTTPAHDLTVSTTPEPEVTSPTPEPEEVVPSESPGPADAPAIKKLTPFKRTLYIQEQGTVLARHDDRLLVKKEDRVLLDVPAAKVDQIFVFGRCAITTPAMTFCLQEDIPIVLLSSRGQYYGLLETPMGDRVSLHRQQFARAADPAFALATAKAVVRGKLRNSRVLLQRHQRRRGIDAVKHAIDQIDAILTRMDVATTVTEVCGYEGAGAAQYFNAFACLLQQDLGFSSRQRRPPPDPVNSLLSFGYTLCFYNIYALICGRGLHPYVGHLHQMRDRHPALVSDLLEEFRAPIVDSLVLYLVNAKVVTAADFQLSKVDGACFLRDAARKTFLQHFEQKMSSVVMHARTGDSVDWRRAMDTQVAHMRQWICGEVTGYRPMEMR